MTIFDFAMEVVDLKVKKFLCHCVRSSWRIEQNKTELFSLPVKFSLIENKYVLCTPPTDKIAILHNYDRKCFKCKVTVEKKVKFSTI